MTNHVRKMTVAKRNQPRFAKRRTLERRRLFFESLEARRLLAYDWMIDGAGLLTIEQDVAGSAEQSDLTISLELSGAPSAICWILKPAR